MEAMLAAEMERNAALKATLAKLNAPAPTEVVEQTETQKKAASALRVIDMTESELKLKQAIEQGELQMKQLEQVLKEKKQDLKAVQTEIDKERSSGKAVWETVGISTVTYRDPFHTGLSKRTPTGARTLARGRPSNHAAHPTATAPLTARPRAFAPQAATSHREHSSA